MAKNLSPLLCFCLGLGLAWFSACAPASQSDETAVVAVATTPHLQAHTVVPKEFGQEMAAEPPGDVLVPAVMLKMGEVSRTRAEVRVGPGAQYELSDTVLTQGTKVILTAIHGVWRKILVVGTWQQGWVHHQALATNHGSDPSVRVAMKHLPTVLVVRPIGSARSYDQDESLAVAIPRGTMFRELRRDAASSLVWLPQTNSTIWLSRKDVQ